MAAYTRNPQTVPDDSPGGSTTRQAVADQNNVAVDDLYTALNAHSNSEEGRTHSEIDGDIDNIQSVIDANSGGFNAALYSGSETYNKGKSVIGSDANTYRCVNDGVTGDNPVGSTTGNWVVLTLGVTKPQVKNSDFDAVPYQQYVVDTTIGEITATLPVSALVGHVISIADYAGTFADNNCIIGRNGHNIMGIPENIFLDISNVSISLMYVDLTQGWRLV